MGKNHSYSKELRSQGVKEFSVFSVRSVVKFLKSQGVLVVQKIFVQLVSFVVKKSVFSFSRLRLLKTRFAHISEQVRAVKALRGYRC